jgi:hypothetical protein
MKNVSALGMSTAMAALLVFAAPAHAAQHEVTDERDITEEEVRSYLEEVRDEVMELVREEQFHRIGEVTQRHIADGAVFAITGQMMKDDERKSFMAATLEKEDLVAMRHRAVGMMHGIDIEDYTLEVEVEEVRAHGPGAATVKATWTDRGAVSLDTAAETGQMQHRQMQPGQMQPGQQPGEQQPGQMQPGQQDTGQQQETTPQATRPGTTAQTAQEQTGQQQEEGRLTFERTFECHHVVQREDAAVQPGDEAQPDDTVQPDDAMQRENGQLRIGLTTCQAEARL